MRIWRILFGIGLLVVGYLSSIQDHSQKYPLEYRSGNQIINLGEVPRGRYIMSVAYVSAGKSEQGPVAKIVVNDVSGKNVYDNIRRNSDRQYVFPEFENTVDRQLIAVIELHEPTQTDGKEMMLWVRKKNSAIYDYSLYFVVTALAIAGAALILFQIRARSKRPH
jgi:hypothetical protein